jgi:PBP1b-binding outer membrane lipoprotein LpoB
MVLKKAFFIVLVALFLAGCVAGPPVREGLKENLKVPAGTIEGFSPPQLEDDY